MEWSFIAHEQGIRTQVFFLFFFSLDAILVRPAALAAARGVGNQGALQRTLDRLLHEIRRLVRWTVWYSREAGAISTVLDVPVAELGGDVLVDDVAGVTEVTEAQEQNDAHCGEPAGATLALDDFERLALRTPDAVLGGESTMQQHRDSLGLVKHGNKAAPVEDGEVRVKRVCIVAVEGAEHKMPAVVASSTLQHEELCPRFPREHLAVEVLVLVCKRVVALVEPEVELAAVDVLALGGRGSCEREGFAHGATEEEHTAWQQSVTLDFRGSGVLSFS